MSTLLSAFHRLLADIMVSRGVHLDPPSDITMSWVLKEGPKLDKEVLKYLEDPEGEPPGMPDWLMPLWLAFISNDDIRDLAALRQILVFCYKAEFEPTNEQMDEAYAKFIDTDQTVGLWNHYHTVSVDMDRDQMFREARRLVSRVIYRADWDNITPSHGPGAVYPPRAPVDKSKFDTIYDSIQMYYPFDQYYCGIPSFWEAAMWIGSPRIIKSESRIVSKVVAVPKDSRGPRLICVHPAEAIWIQQGQRRVLEACISSSRLTCGNIKFHDQTQNGRLALVASRDREFMTLDLSEASDRIGTRLVQYLLGPTYGKFACARSDYYQIGNVVRKFQKFAPMGNCTIFPLQSLVFWSIVRAGIRVYHGTYCDDVYVFGDDIIVPSKYGDATIKALVRCGLVPNMQKTFRKGFFRESCGVEAYRGYDITPYRMKKQDVTSWEDAVSFCDLAKRLRRGNRPVCSAYLYSCVRRWLWSTRKWDLPLCNDYNAQGIYEYVEALTPVVRSGNFRFNRKLQRAESRVILLRSAEISPTTGDWSLLQDSLLRISDDPISERRTSYPVPYRVRPSYGWMPIP